MSMEPKHNAAKKGSGVHSPGPQDLLPGTLDAMILAALAETSNHGYGIARDIESRAGGELSIEEGSLYPALHRLQAQGDLEFEWKTTEFNRRGKYYSLTTAGRKRLQAEVASWQRASTAVGRVLGLIEFPKPVRAPRPT